MDNNVATTVGIVIGSIFAILVVGGAITASIVIIMKKKKTPTDSQ